VRHIFADCRVCLVHGSFSGDKGDHTAGVRLILMVTGTFVSPAILRYKHNIIFAIPFRSVYKELLADRETGC